MRSAPIWQIREFFKAVWAGAIARLSGIGSVVLTVLSFLPTFSNTNKAFIVAACVCWLYTSFDVWKREYQTRRELERESGPQVMLEIDKSGTLIFHNVGNDVAEKVTIDVLNEHDIKIGISPDPVSFIEPSKTQACFSRMWRQRKNFSTTTGVHDFVRELQRPVNFVVSYTNSQQLRYKREFAVTVDALGGELICTSNSHRAIEKVKNV